MPTPVKKRIRETSHPLLYEVNTRVLLHELSEEAGTTITLGTIPESLIGRWAFCGFDAIWLMGVWTPGPTGVEIARTHPGLQEEYRKSLHDLEEQDIVGSPYAVQSYAIPTALGGEEGLRTFRERLAGKGIGLMLDVVCNHTARDHSWLVTHPEYYVQGGEENIGRDSFRVSTDTGERVIAFGRDPYFPGWTDTAQLNFCSRATRRAVTDTINHVAGMCDGVRCDMAMLVLEDVFRKTWGDMALSGVSNPASGEFWSEAIQEVRSQHPDFLFIAESYWGLEWQLQQMGFDYTYDKTLYDRMLREGASAVRDHLKADLDFQRHSLRFIENHDEPRAAQTLASDAWNCAAATIISAVPGMVMYHDGQMEGRKIRVPVQLRRREKEQTSTQVKGFYERLLLCINSPIFRKGTWKVLNVKPAWPDNYTWQDFLAFSWHEESSGTRLVVVNYAPHNSQGYVELELPQSPGSAIEFRDLVGDAVYVRENTALSSRGMYFDLPAYGLHIFGVTKAHRGS